MKNYYEILEIPYTASPQEIHRTYLKLSDKYHPDNNGGVSFFNTVYKQIQEAYKVLSNESLKAEYDRSINNNETVKSAYDQSEKTEFTLNDLNKKSKLKETKPESFKTFTVLLITIFILAAGYFVYDSYSANNNETQLDLEVGKSVFAFDAKNSNEENLKKLLEAENKRDFDVIKTFYSGDLERYWNSRNLNFEKLNNQYKKAWKISSNSKNNILDINKIDDNILHVTTEFSFTNAKTNKTITLINLDKYVFNTYGLITQVYNINPEKEYDEYRDVDFSLISNEEKIRRLLSAEDIRDFNKIASFYAPEIDRYWNVENIKISDLKKQYDLAWKNTSSSYNNVLKIKKVGYYTYQLKTRFYFETSENEAELRISENIYVFNSEGLVTQVYDADPI